LLAGVGGQQVYATDGLCASFAGFSCAPSLMLVSADSSGMPMGGDHAAVDIEDAFATFSGGASAGGPAQVFLAAVFF
jgi:hypothetical protein